MADTNDNSLAEGIDQLLESVVRRVRTRGTADSPQVEVVAPLTLGELIEKLAILHCRLWSLEDLVRDTGLDASEHRRLTQTILELNSTLRPTLVRSIDMLFIAACRGDVPLHAVPEKLYTRNPAPPDGGSPSASQTQPGS